MNKVIDLISNKYNPALSGKYSISIRQKEDGYTFVIVDNENRPLLARSVECNPTKEHKQLLDDELFKLQYNSVRFIGCDTATCVNNGFLCDKNVLFLPLEQSLRKRATLLTSPLNDETTLVAYTNKWQPLLVPDKKEHIYSTLFHSVRDKNNVIRVDIETKSINLLAIKDGKIIILNHYNTAQLIDIEYFILSIYEQAQLSQTATPLLISGYYCEQIKEKLSQYIAQIEVVTPQWNSEFEESLAPIFSLNLCE